MTKIVCVEDEEMIRALIVDELEDAGYQVVQAADGAEGLNVILNEQPDLVLSDWLMPQMSGPDLLSALRQDHPDCAALPFVFVSAYSDDQSCNEGVRLGASAYIPKPVKFDFLLDTVARLIVPDTRIRSA